MECCQGVVYATRERSAVRTGRGRAADSIDFLRSSAVVWYDIAVYVAMQMVSIGFIIGVIQDSMETALNSSEDVLFAATAEFHDMMKRGEKASF